MAVKTGKVILVGSGPGDPGLITVRGKEAIESAEIVVYDNLASPIFLSYAPSDSEKIHVGKKGASHTMEQAEINQLLVDKASEGKTVVRLKGGDPYIFGRGSEEAEFLAQNGIEFEVVPGIPAAIGASATAGIPLTDRRYTSTLAFITGHEDPTKDESSIEWEHLAKGIGTIVIYMGVKTLPAVMAKLIEHGRDPETPVAVVEWATTPRQRIIRGNLRNIAQIAEENEIKPPSLAIIGKVNTIGDILNWFEKRPLFGKTIAVTRSRLQASQLVRELRVLGADVLETPTIDIKPPENWDELDRAARGVSSYDWIIFTSPNGVRFFFERMRNAGFDTRKLAAAKIASIGPATSEELQNHGINPDYQPLKYVSESIFQGLKDIENLDGKKILMPRSELARENLADFLRDNGALVDDIPAYRNVPADFDVDSFKSLIADGKVDAITFTSSSTVDFFVERMSGEFINRNIRNINAASIGPITSETLKTHGIQPVIEADEFTIPGLVKKILEYYSSQHRNKKK